MILLYCHEYYTIFKRDFIMETTKSDITQKLKIDRLLFKSSIAVFVKISIVFTADAFFLVQNLMNTIFYYQNK